jgi:hypothetical protein
MKRTGVDYIACSARSKPCFASDVETSDGGGGAGAGALCDPVLRASMTNVTPPHTLLSPRRKKTEDLKAVGCKMPAKANSSPLRVWYRALELRPIWPAQVRALRMVGGGLFWIEKEGSSFLRTARRRLERAVPASPATNPTAANCTPLKTKVPARSSRE